MWLKNLDTKKIGEEIFGDLQNLVLKDKGEDKMAPQSN